VRVDAVVQIAGTSADTLVETARTVEEIAGTVVDPAGFVV
jgi:hypothetical protein